MFLMIPRALHARIRSRLDQFPAVMLLGPRQVGKTTLARRVAADRDATHLDLEDLADLAKLADAGGYLRRHRGRLVVLDEIQRTPEIFPLLRVLIDEGIQSGLSAGQFLILGSASLNLLRQSGETLAGRVAMQELSPLDVRETGLDDRESLWVRGGFPPSFLASSDRRRAIWRAEFIRTYLERDLPRLGPRVPAETLRRLWTMLAHGQGDLLNASSLASALAVDGKTVAKYVDLLVDLLLVRRLTPYAANVRKRLVKAPRLYVRDSGLVHTLLRLDDAEAVLGHPVSGKSWEGFVVETLIRAAPERTQASFYRKATGVEADLVLELPADRLWMIEIKRSLAPTVSRGLRVAVDDLQPDKTFIAYPGAERYPVGPSIEVVGFRELAEELAGMA